MRNRFVLLLDLPLIAIAAFGAFALRFDWLFLDYRPEFTFFLGAALIVKPLVYAPFGMYRRYWRHGSIEDVLAIVLAVTAASTALALVVGLARVWGIIPFLARPVIPIDWLLTLALAGGLRFSIRVIADYRRRAKAPAAAEVRRVLIVGAGEAGSMVVREIARNPQLGLEVVGYLDDSPAKHGKQIHGVRVYGDLSDLPGVVRDHRVDEVIIAMPTVGGAIVRHVADACRELGVPSRILPGVYELLDGRVSVNRLRSVEVSDLLRRRPVSAQVAAASYLSRKVVMVTGAGGSIGSELSRQVAFAWPARLILLGHGENSIYAVHQQLTIQYPGVPIVPVIADIRNGERLKSVFAEHAPDVVFHAAAHKHVPLMEANPEEAFTNNVGGTRNLVRAAVAAGTSRFVLISTDKAVAPSSIMGASKRIAEDVVLDAGMAAGLPFVAVRFGNVLGSRGSVVPLLKSQIERGGPLTITHPEMKRFFMTIPEAVHLVLQAGGLGAPGSLFVLNMGEPVKVVDLARDLIRLSGLDENAIPITFTGMRPGEKLEEELWEPDAELNVTENPDIFVVRERRLGLPAERQTLIDGLLQAAARGDVPAVLDRLAAIVPGYTQTPGAQPAGTPRR